MSYDGIKTIFEEVEHTLDEPTWYVQLYWQAGADEHGIVSLVQGNWSSPSQPCPWERAMTVVMGIRENRGDAVMLVAHSQHQAEQLMMQAIRLGARSVLDE